MTRCHKLHVNQTLDCCFSNWQFYVWPCYTLHGSIQEAVLTLNSTPRAALKMRLGAAPLVLSLREFMMLGLPDSDLLSISIEIITIIVKSPASWNEILQTKQAYGMHNDNACSLRTRRPLQ